MKKLFYTFITLLVFQNALSAESLRYIDSSRNDAATLNRSISELATQITQNKNFINIEAATIAITSFVCLDNFETSYKVGNILSENLIHEMQVRGYSIIDFKTMENIKVGAKGDFLFTRDLTKLRKTLNIDYALTGTYSQYQNGIVVNARIIDLKTHIILSSAQIFLSQKVLNSIIYVPHKTLLFK